MRRSTVLILVGLAVAGAWFAFVPFGRRVPTGSYTYGDGFATTSSSCGSPIVSAWRREPAETGWFGYAPLTAQRITDEGSGLHTFATVGQPASCADTARRRLAIGVLLMGPGVLVWFLRRRHFEPPTNPGPSLAM